MMTELFTPAKIGNCVIPNRLIVPAMVMNLCTEDGMITERYIKYIEEKAKGGWGMVITEDYAVNENAKGYKFIPGLYNDEQIEGNRKLTETVHKYDTKLFCQMYHPGRQSKHDVNARPFRDQGPLLHGSSPRDHGRRDPSDREGLRIHCQKSERGRF